MSRDETTETDPLMGELTAYLDGELDEVRHREVEQRLSSDSGYREQMRDLQRTWDMLDRLPTTEPNQSFTRTTMEMVVGEARKEVGWKLSWFWPARFLAAVAMFGALFALGFTMLRSAQTRTDRMLLEHLPVVVNMEGYTAVDLDLDFVEQMASRKLFSRNELSTLSRRGLTGGGSDPGVSEDGTSANTVDALAPEATPEQRSAWISQLDLDQKERLKRKLDEFLELSPQRREEMIQFERLLVRHPDADELRFVIDEYHEWLKLLDGAPRSRLLDLPVAERLDSIARQREIQAREQFVRDVDGLPSREDADSVFQWFLSAINAKESAIRKHFPVAVATYRRELELGPIPDRILDALARKAQLNQLVDYLIEIDQPFVESLLIDDGSIDLLYVMLKPTARRMLSEQGETGQRELLISWIQRVNDAYYNISQERLREFAENLPQEDKDRLDQLSSSTYFARLRELYLERNSPSAQTEFDWRRLLNSETPFRRR